MRRLAPMLLLPILAAVGCAAQNTWSPTVDTFGNLISNIDASLVSRFRSPVAQLGGHSFSLMPTYGRARPGDYLALINSFGVLEIARAEGSAAEGLGADRGAPVMVRESG